MNLAAHLNNRDDFWPVIGRQWELISRAIDVWGIIPDEWWILPKVKLNLRDIANADPPRNLLFRFVATYGRGEGRLNSFLSTRQKEKVADD